MLHRLWQRARGWIRIDAKQRDRVPAQHPQHLFEIMNRNEVDSMTVTTEVSAKQQARYSLQELLPYAQTTFGVKPEVMHGVFHDAADRTFTIEEVHTNIQQFMKAKVE
ncbi:hypothetical protein SK066_17820 [Paenibacillus hunanensis]|uniref:hypothetical protein n=1 Tax=Paenibacillus hunanensis TaxID=539262 RepID=UPI002A6A5D60|nr:hypothetical protein [Paenibacillus hunanensis]WPP40441.1 hypothetical protein SK066_17820 [Paenibacillus hunanensis]